MWEFQETELTIYQFHTEASESNNSTDNHHVTKLQLLTIICEI